MYFPETENEWRLSVLFACCIQAHLLQLLQRSQPEMSWFFIFLQCAATTALFWRGNNDVPKSVSVLHTLLQSLLYTASLALPLVAFFVAPDLASVPVATAMRTGGIIVNLMLRGDRSVIRWYGAAFVCYGLFHITASFEWSEKDMPRSFDTYTADMLRFFIKMHADVWQRLSAVALLFAGTLCGTLLGICQETQGSAQNSLYIFASLALAPMALDTLFTHAARCNFDDLILMTLFAIASACAALALKEYQKGTRNDSYKLTYLLTVRRFLTMAFGSLLYTRQQQSALLMGGFFVAFGIVIIELHFAVERSKAKRLAQSMENK